MVSQGLHHSPIEYEKLTFSFPVPPPPKVSEMIFPGCDREREGGVKAKAWNWMLWHLAFNTSLAPSQHLVEDKCLKLKLEHRTLRKWNIHSGHPLCCVFVFRFFWVRISLYNPYWPWTCYPQPPPLEHCDSLCVFLSPVTVVESFSRCLLNATIAPDCSRCWWRISDHLSFTLMELIE